MDPCVSFNELYVCAMENATDFGRFVGGKMVDFAATVEPYMSQVVEQGSHYASLIGREVTAFAVTHPVLAQAVFAIVAVAVALKITAVACDRYFDKPKAKLQFTGWPVEIPRGFPASKSSGQSKVEKLKKD